MHHAYDDDGMGWCMFDDVHLAIRKLRVASGGAVKKVMCGV
jgi:acetoin utilization deacetylase AcuC-like enzyme